ncbi:hypothetical protein MMC25_006314 [Agyrium rufum]|nr:hypothetical protein [Agyrium rufum]
MTPSPTAKPRADLIREMARELGASRRSAASSRASSHASPDTTSTTFDPENEALMSTQTFNVDDLSQQLPELRASAQEYRRYTRPEPAFAIDTSAMDKAFPDFTQVGPSSEEDDSRSIELGRGITAAQAQQMRDEIAKKNNMEGSNSLNDSFAFNNSANGKLEALYTPNNKTSARARREAANVSLRRDEKARRASSLRKELGQTSPQPSKVTQQPIGGNRSSINESQDRKHALRARVSDFGDDSFANNRPPTIDLTLQSTRFRVPSNQGKHDMGLPNSFGSANTFGQAISQANAVKSNLSRFQAANNTVTSQMNSVGQNSFLLPDMPNTSELVTGVFQDGTPVFPRTSQGKTSRFASGSDKDSASHSKVAAITIPEDEQAIYVSLKILQDKVAEMEVARMEGEAHQQDLQAKNDALQREKNESRRWRGADSALGTTDGSENGDDAIKSPRQWAVEKSRMNTLVKSLQERVESADRKIEAATSSIKEITGERDAAVSQLGLAFLTTRELRAENENLKDENLRLEARLAQFLANHQDETQQWKKTEETLRKKIQRRDETLHTFQQMKGRKDVSKIGHVDKENVAPKNVPTKQRVPLRETEDDTQLSHLSLPVPRTRNVPSQPRAQGLGAEAIKKPTPAPAAVTAETMDDETSSSFASDFSFGFQNVMQKAHDGQVAVAVEDSEDSEDLTFLSYVDKGEIAQLRQVLEAERIARKERSSRPKLTKPVEVKKTTTNSQEQTNTVREPTMSRKSSLKAMPTRRDVTGTTHTQPVHDQTNHTKASVTTHARRHSEDSIHAQRTRAQSIAVEDMTSAFLVPDITFRIPETKTSASTVTHAFKNCTVCATHHADGAPHRKVTIPKPVSVSDRVPNKTIQDEITSDITGLLAGAEPTIRPSQPPSLALATVMKCLEDELAHLKLRRAKYQVLYDQHDPSLGKRKRKAVYEKIRAFSRTIDAKADQIYALYDVLEGQKQAGEEMGEGEVEVTLKNIGVDVGNFELGLRGGENESVVLESDISGKTVDEGTKEVNNEPKKTAREPWCFDDSVDKDDDEELPWEGIENTVGTMKSNASRRSWA